MSRMTTAEALVRAAWLAADQPGRTDIAAVAEAIMGGQDANNECRAAITSALEACSRVSLGTRGRDARGRVTLDDGDIDIYWTDTGGYTEWCDAAGADPDALAELLDAYDDALAQAHGSQVRGHSR